MESNLKLYSLGIVVKDKVRGSDDILVTPIEDLNIQPAGNIAESKKEFKGQKQSLSSVDFKTEHESKNYVQAKWRSLEGTNRLSAPDVYANQTVLLLKFGDVDEYYWTTLGREPVVQGREDVTYAFSNKASDLTAYDRNKSYWFQVNTFDKFVQFHTAKNDGEPVGYDIKIDTRKGVFSVVDTAGNSITINSQAGDISMKAKGSINLEAQTITMKAGTVVHDTPMVKNTGEMNTSGGHRAHPNYNAIPR